MVERCDGGPAHAANGGGQRGVHGRGGVKPVFWLYFYGWGDLKGEEEESHDQSVLINNNCKIK